MKIGELSEKTGLSKDTLRFYEKFGLFEGYQAAWLPNGYKDYPVALVEHLRLVQSGKNLGFTLSEMKKILQSWIRNELSQADKLQLFQGKLLEIDEKKRELELVRGFLEEKIAWIESGAGGFRNDMSRSP